jgi:predicted dehydrogenase
VRARGRVSAAIVGAGLMGRWHARAVEHAGGVVSAVIDADAARAARLAAAHGARAVSSLGALASGDPVDVVHICTPLETHATLVREAIGLGVHALVEKPLASTAEVTEQILRDAGAKDLLICPVHQFTFQRGVRDILAALPQIGPVLHVQVVACSAGADTGDADARDRVAADILPHPLSLFSVLLDVSLADAAWETRRMVPGELVATGAVSSTTLSILISMAGRPTTNSLRVIGARGTAHADQFHGFATIESGDVSRARKILHPFKLAGATLVDAFDNLARRAITRDSAYPGLRELVTAFHAAVRGEALPPFPAARVLDIARARDALLDSARGRAVPEWQRA